MSGNVKFENNLTCLDSYNRNMDPNADLGVKRLIRKSQNIKCGFAGLKKIEADQTCG